MKAIRMISALLIALTAAVALPACSTEGGMNSNGSGTSSGSAGY